VLGANGVVIPADTVASPQLGGDSADAADTTATGAASADSADGGPRR
jgi:hypothetical protein